ncbi:Senecionine N-oxygenase [Xanthoria calcicola]
MTPIVLRVGVLALQGAFVEHVKLLRQAVAQLRPESEASGHVNILEVRTAEELRGCDALIIPGGESTTVSLVAERSNLLEPLRHFVKVLRRPTWGTCAGLILLAESANRIKKGGQELIGGLDVRVNRNYFGRQTESFEADLNLPFLKEEPSADQEPFRGIFIRAPVVEKLLPPASGEQKEEAVRDETVIAPAKDATHGQGSWPVEVMATLPGRTRRLVEKADAAELDEETGDIIAVRQRNVFGTSFHPELTSDARIHVWWLRTVFDACS